MRMNANLQNKLNYLNEEKRYFIALNGEIPAELNEKIRDIEIIINETNET